jgi:hypothetical protein
MQAARRRQLTAALPSACPAKFTRPPAPLALTHPLTSSTHTHAQIERELHRERNIRPSFNLGGGLLGGIAYSALDAYLLRGNAPWTFRHRWVGSGGQGGRQGQAGAVGRHRVHGMVALALVPAVRLSSLPRSSSSFLWLVMALLPASPCCCCCAGMATTSGCGLPPTSLHGSIPSPTARSLLTSPPHSSGG